MGAVGRPETLSHTRDLPGLYSPYHAPAVRRRWRDERSTSPSLRLGSLQRVLVPGRPRQDAVTQRTDAEHRPAHESRRRSIDKRQRRAQDRRSNSRGGVARSSRAVAAANSADRGAPAETARPVEITFWQHAVRGLPAGVVQEAGRRVQRVQDQRQGQVPGRARRHLGAEAQGRAGRRHGARRGHHQLRQHPGRRRERPVRRARRADARRGVRATSRRTSRTSSPGQAASTTGTRCSSSRRPCSSTAPTWSRPPASTRPAPPKSWDELLTWADEADQGQRQGHDDRLGRARPRLVELGPAVQRVRPPADRRRLVCRRPRPSRASRSSSSSTRRLYQEGLMPQAAEVRLRRRRPVRPGRGRHDGRRLVGGRPAQERVPRDDRRTRRSPRSRRSTATRPRPTATLGGWTLTVDAQVEERRRQAADVHRVAARRRPGDHGRLLQASGFSKYTVRTSVDEALADDPDATSDPFMKIITEKIVPYGKAEPAYPWDISLAFGTAIESAMKGKHRRARPRLQKADSTHRRRHQEAVACRHGARPAQASARHSEGRPGTRRPASPGR